MWQECFGGDPLYTELGHCTLEQCLLVHLSRRGARGAGSDADDAPAVVAQHLAVILFDYGFAVAVGLATIGRGSKVARGTTG